MAPKRTLFRDFSSSSSSSSSSGDENIERQIEQVVETLIQLNSIQNARTGETLIDPTQQTEESDDESEPDQDAQQNLVQTDDSEEPDEPEIPDNSIRTLPKSVTGSGTKSSLKLKNVPYSNGKGTVDNPKSGAGLQFSSIVKNAPNSTAKGKRSLIEETKKGSAWSRKDEIAILQGLIDFTKANKSNHDEFYDSVKNKLDRGDCTKYQLMLKVGRMRKMFMDTSIVGKEPEFLNFHERKCYRLSTIIWGIKGTPEPTTSSKANGCGSRSVKRVKLSQDQGKGKDDEEEEEERMIVGGKGESRVRNAMYPELMKAFETESCPKLSAVDGMKSRLKVVEKSVLGEWDMKWKAIYEAELHLYVRRLDLVQQVTSHLFPGST